MILTCQPPNGTLKRSFGKAYTASWPIPSSNWHQQAIPVAFERQNSWLTSNCHAFQWTMKP
jgi:hypothetical protein